MRLALAMLVLGCCICCCDLARADTAVVTPDRVCAIQHAIRWHHAEWPDWQCLRVSEAINAAAEKTGQRPVTLLAIAVTESDLRPNVEHWYGDIAPGTSGDLGLMGVRCKLGPNMLCSNGVLRGWKYPAAMRIEANVMLAARILASKPTLNDYNGGKGYAERIRAIAAAIMGVRVPVASKRVRKLIGQIVGAIARMQEGRTS